MPVPGKQPVRIVRPCARFHADQTRRQAAQPFGELGACYARQHQHGLASRSTA